MQTFCNWQTHDLIITRTMQPAGYSKGGWKYTAYVTISIYVG